MKPTLLILAAGMGSRYGGLKQLDSLGPNGETIMDYSINDAIAAGFNRVVFVIRRSMEDDFRSVILSKYQNKIAVDYQFQELDNLPEEFKVNKDRVKPYGTAHAILVAKKSVNAPFAVINADDFYGRDAFKTISEFLQQDFDPAHPLFAMVGYQLGKTLSENGSVSRGVCITNEKDELVSITEMRKIKRYPDGIKNAEDDGKLTLLDEKTPVSMNFWGFTPDFFDHLDSMFVDFLRENNYNPAAEFPIPSVINHFLTTKKAVIKVLKSSAEWFGVTYHEDRENVVAKLKNIQY
jgi:UTP-glucose-1-phosphate uridylyltransferase